MKRSLAKNISVLHNPIVLYIVLAIALVYLLQTLYVGDMRHTIIFVLVGVVVSFFSKNMVVILTIAVAFTSIAKMVWRGSMMEGMEDGEPDTENTDAVSSSAEDANSATEKKKNETTENMDNKDDDEEDDADNFAVKQKLKKDGKELLEVQDKLEEGFEKLEPFMEKADELLTRIET